MLEGEVLLYRELLRPTAVKFDSTTAAPIMSWVVGGNLLLCCRPSLYLLIVVATIMSMSSVFGKSALPSSSEKTIGSFCEAPFPSAGGVTKEDSTKSGLLIFLEQGLARVLLLGLSLPAVVVIVLLVRAGEETERREEIELVADFFRNKSSRENTRSSVSGQKKYSSPES